MTSESPQKDLFKGFATLCFGIAASILVFGFVVPFFDPARDVTISSGTIAALGATIMIIAGRDCFYLAHGERPTWTYTLASLLGLLWLALVFGSTPAF